MNTEDKLFNQIKSAANNAETQDFPSMDKVWNRVEEKLDKKALASQNTLWKKIAVAASILLVISIGYQFFKEEKTLTTPKSTIVNSDSKRIKADSVEQQQAVAEADSETVSPVIRQNAAEIIHQQAEHPNAVAATITRADEKKAEPAAYGYIAPASEEKAVLGNWMGQNNFQSRGVTYRNDTIIFEADHLVAVKPTQEKKKDDALIVLNGKSSSKKEVSQLPDEIIEKVVLPDPLYIINGVRYTEQELFGPNPTSPYSPLNKQQIETISILQDEKATSIYGEKGKKGVVIITTKDGKPAAVKGR